VQVVCAACAGELALEDRSLFAHLPFCSPASCSGHLIVRVFRHRLQGGDNKLAPKVRCLRAGMRCHEAPQCHGVHHSKGIRTMQDMSTSLKEPLHGNFAGHRSIITS